ncbi:MAG TPA: ChbG/HpnK family deacetylase [Arenimonas sp.]|uniref:carbohydrate deacetylase n=1 Tax=Arenimonas sp. TaxID=1872635 RepID=UPI002D80B708|nr:ChbG/HpnK family deacetylase [Arenimonas sp.]HEU0152066.1 ChbG/HpnK family deacetylase [Arenimonas sp.]
MKTLIVNADDFGLAPAVNQGILDAHLAGSVTSTTLMVNMPAAAEAAAIAKAHPALGVGLHFNLTLGKPLAGASSVPSLVGPDGNFHERSALARGLFTGRVRREHLVRELDAQHQAYLALGIRPTHVDSHQHVHGFPAVFDAIAALCEAQGIPTRMPWLLKLGGSRPSAGRALRQWLLGRMLRRNVRQWQGRVQWNAGMGSLFDLGAIPAQPTLGDYRCVLEAAGEGVFELMVHPVPEAEAVRGLTRIGHVSAAEWQVLSKPGLDQLAAGLGFRMANFASAFGPSARGVDGAA